MTRRWLALTFATALAVAAAAQDAAHTPPPPEPGANAPADDSKYEQPPEEDDTLKPKQYTFNPILADRSLKIGAFYYKRGKYKAAADRFDEATKWNPGLAEAWYRLGESEEKLGELDGMRKAWKKYLELQPNAKESATVRRKLARQGSGDKS